MLALLRTQVHTATKRISLNALQLDRRFLLSLYALNHISTLVRYSNTFVVENLVQDKLCLLGLPLCNQVSPQTLCSEKATGVPAALK